MTNHTNQDLREWIDDWQAETEGARPKTAAEEIRVHVRKRERMLWWWIVMEFMIAIGAFMFLVHRAITDPDPMEKVAMGLLALAVVGVSWFEGWNWRGTLRPSAENTSAFLAIALDRSRRLERSLRAGWVLLAAEVLIFTPWIWHNLRDLDADTRFERSVFAWGLLISMMGAGALALFFMQVWARRDAAGLETLKRELNDEVQEGTI
jgi:hypothetical protein